MCDCGFVSAFDRVIKETSKASHITSIIRNSTKDLIAPNAVLLVLCSIHLHGGFPVEQYLQFGISAIQCTSSPSHVQGPQCAM